jgi:hypothetical protein
VVAAAFFAYFETDPQPGNPATTWAAGTGLIFCPGSLLFVTWIDIEPQTSAFAIMWLVIGLINFALYGAIGMFVGRLLWKIDGEPPRETVAGPRAGG